MLSRQRHIATHRKTHNPLVPNIQRSIFNNSMVKRLSTLLVLLMLLCATDTRAQSANSKRLYATFKDSYESKGDSMTNAFIESFMIKTKGIFNDRYQTYASNAYWTQAHAIDVVIYNYERHKGIDATLARTYLNYIKLWYKNKANNYMGTAAKSTTAPSISTDYRMFENRFTDDMCWITLTLLHIAEATGITSYATVARQVFDNYIIKRATEDEETGGLSLPWNTDSGSGPNACTQSPATLIAAKLYQKFGQDKYLEYAKKLYTYTAQKIVKSDGRVEEPPLTYTQGTFGEACRLLYHITDESATIRNKYKTLAYTYLNYAFTSSRCTNGQNILRDEGSSGDQSIFKAVLIPYAVNYVLDPDMTINNRLNLCKLILKNTAMMWSKLDFTRYPIVFCNYNWTTTYSGEDSQASMGAMCSGASLVENTARMCRAITDRYRLEQLYQQCSNFTVDTLYQDDTAFQAFASAMTSAKQIIDNPCDYTTSQFKEAMDNLAAAYQAAQDRQTGIMAICNWTNPTFGHSEGSQGIYDMSGRKLSDSETAKQPKGRIYIKGGRKVLR